MPRTRKRRIRAQPRRRSPRGNRVPRRTSHRAPRAQGRPGAPRACPTIARRQPVKALVVGYGRMGRFHTKVLADLGYDVSTLDPDPGAGADYQRTDPIATYDAVAIAT